MEIIKEIFMRNLFSSLKLSAIIILLLILTKPITKRYTAGFRYYSWLVIMIIFLIPFKSVGVTYKINVSDNIINNNYYNKNTPENISSVEPAKDNIKNKDYSKTYEINTFINTFKFINSAKNTRNFSREMNWRKWQTCDKLI